MSSYFQFASMTFFFLIAEVPIDIVVENRFFGYENKLFQKLCMFKIIYAAAHFMSCLLTKV